MVKGYPRVCGGTTSQDEAGTPPDVIRSIKSASSSEGRRTPRHSRSMVLRSIGLVWETFSANCCRDHPSCTSHSPSTVSCFACGRPTGRFRAVARFFAAARFFGGSPIGAIFCMDSAWVNSCVS